MKFIVTILLTFSILEVEGRDGVRTPNFLKTMETFCVENPYDCTKNKIVTPHLLNTFLYTFYLEVEDYFFKNGFDRAEFEHCRTANCLIEGVNVKNTPYKITKAFPRRGNYFDALGGVNQNLGIHFMKTSFDSDKICDLKVRPGNRVPRGARKEMDRGVITLKELRDKYFKKYDLLYVVTVPKISAVGKIDLESSGECWLRKGTKNFVFELVK